MNTKHLKSSLIGLSAVAIVLAGGAAAHAQTVTDWSSVTAVGSAGSQVVYIPNSSLNASQFAIANSGNAVPANYRPGYYNYPGYVMTTSNTTTTGGSWVNGVWVASNTSLPGVPNTGGSVATTGTTNGIAANGSYYVAPMTSWSSTGGITGGVSLPPGYSPAIGVNGSILTTSNWTNSNTAANPNWNNPTYPGVPNTGGTMTTSSNTSGSWVNGVWVNNGMWGNGGTVRVNGIVTIITPTAIGISSGGQTWTIGWNSATNISTANSSANMTGGQIMLGDMIEVDGVIDATFSSKINATAIRNLSFH